MNRITLEKVHNCKKNKPLFNVPSRKIRHLHVVSRWFSFEKSLITFDNLQFCQQSKFKAFRLIKIAEENLAQFAKLRSPFRFLWRPQTGRPSRFFQGLCASFSRPSATSFLFFCELWLLSKPFFRCFWRLGFLWSGFSLKLHQFDKKKECSPM